jgi:hypothetical protein
MTEIKDEGLLFDCDSEEEFVAWLIANNLSENQETDAVIFQVQTRDSRYKVFKKDGQLLVITIFYEIYFNISKRTPHELQRLVELWTNLLIIQ